MHGGGGGWTCLGGGGRELDMHRGRGLDIDGGMGGGQRCVMLEMILMMMFTGRGRPEAGHADAAGDTDHGHALASGGARPQDPHLLLPGHGAQERFVFPCCACLLLLSCLLF